MNSLSAPSSVYFGSKIPVKVDNKTIQAFRKLFGRGIDFKGDIARAAQASNPAGVDSVTFRSSNDRWAGMSYEAQRRVNGRLVGITYWWAGPESERTHRFGIQEWKEFLARTFR